VVFSYLLSLSTELYQRFGFEMMLFGYLSEIIGTGVGCGWAGNHLHTSQRRQPRLNPTGISYAHPMV